MLALDWPGQGWSDPDHEPPSSRRYAELCAGFLAAVDAGPVVIVGNSIGGGVAIRHAAAHPEAGARAGARQLLRARCLRRGDARGLRPDGALLPRRGARRALVPAAFAAYYRSVLPLPAAAIQRARIVASADEIVPILADAWAGFAAPDADLRTLAPAIACPVLFTWAVRDRFIQLRRNLPAIRSFPNARVVEFPAGHAPQLETPDAFEAEVERFLQGLPA